MPPDAPTERPDLRTAAQALSHAIADAMDRRPHCPICDTIEPHLERCPVPALRAALAAEATELPPDDEIESLRASLAELDSEHAASARIASAMAAAVGWSTPGETWVEKAAYLAPLAAQLEAARELRADRNGELTDTEPWHPDWAVHPGEMLREELDERGMTQAQLAVALGHADASQVSRLCNGRADINAQTAVRLEQVLGPSAELWLRLQMAYDLHHARRATADA